jgi:hypothetical protein
MTPSLFLDLFVIVSGVVAVVALPCWFFVAVCK